MSIIHLLKKGCSYGVIPFFIFSLLFSSSSLAQYKKSRWAVGLGTGWLQDYAGADQGRLRFLAFPVFRGSLFRIDRVSGVSGKVFDKSRLSFSWNFIFQFPTESDDIPIRKGMPDLDWFLSIGPQVRYTIWANSTQKLFFRFPIRFNLCTNFSQRSRFCGATLNPGIRHVILTENYGEFIARFEAFSNSSEYHNYFYEVHPRYATAERPSYHAKAGFLGFVAGLFHTMPFEGWELVTALNIYDYSLNVNTESPLFRQTTNYGIFSAVTIDF